ncbi:hypothetical protein G9A89_021333 [Geosiphon pyriformis]|nr:hypothetical protein G9A89_021333 [Geosiphon pyriformis]
MSKKKASIGVLHSLIGGSFFQKKKVSVGNVKHSEDEKNIFLVKPGPSYDVYSDMDSVFGNMTNTPKAKKLATNLVCGFLLGSIDYNMNEDNGPLPPSLNISLKKK